MLPVDNARTALVTVLNTVFTDDSFPAEAFDWYPGDYAHSAAVVLMDQRATISRDRFSSQNRIPFAENWEIDLEILVSNDLQPPDAAQYIGRVQDKIITEVASNTRLDGATGLVRCFVGSLGTKREDSSIKGEMTLNCEFRLERTRP